MDELSKGLDDGGRHKRQVTSAGRQCNVLRLLCTMNCMTVNGVDFVGQIGSRQSFKP